MNPTKPVGRVYSDQEYSELKNSTDWEFIRTGNLLTFRPE